LASNFYGINRAGLAGTISNNTIGSTTTANSINASSNATANVQSVYGIYVAGTSVVSISGNTISNLTNSSNIATLACVINGICISNGASTVSNNTINNLTIGGGNGTVATASVVGININSASYNHTVSNNTIEDLSNTNATGASKVIGLCYNGSNTKHITRMWK